MQGRCYFTLWITHTSWLLGCRANQDSTLDEREPFTADRDALRGMASTFPATFQAWKKMVHRTFTAGRGHPCTVMFHSQWKNKQIKIKCLFENYPLCALNCTYEWDWFYMKKIRFSTVTFRKRNHLIDYRRRVCRCKWRLKMLKSWDSCLQKGNILVTEITASAEKSKGCVIHLQICAWTPEIVWGFEARESLIYFFPPLIHFV